MNLRLTAYPPGNGPYDRWEMTCEDTARVLVKGPWPLDYNMIRVATDAFHAGVEAARMEDQEPPLDEHGMTPDERARHDAIVARISDPNGPIIMAKPYAT